MANDYFLICFYRSDTIPALITRLGTQRKDQPFSEVPNHCSIITPEVNPETGQGLLYEFVATGCQVRDVIPIVDATYTIGIHFPEPEKAIAFLHSCLHLRYGWLTIADIVLCKFLPDKWLSWYKLKAKRICSWLVIKALEEGGYVLPAYIKSQIDPISPNDVWFMLKEYPNGAKE